MVDLNNLGRTWYIKKKIDREKILSIKTSSQNNRWLSSLTTIILIQQKVARYQSIELFV